MFPKVLFKELKEQVWKLAGEVIWGIKFCLGDINFGMLELDMYMK